MNEDTARGQALLPRLKVMNAINKDESSFDDQLLEFVDQAQSDLRLSGLTYDNVLNKKERLMITKNIISGCLMPPS